MPVSSDNCTWFLDRVELYVDGELDGKEREAFESHARSCAPCRRELSLAETVLEELKALPQLRCPEDVVDRAAAAADVGSRGEDSPLRRWFGWLGGYRNVSLRPAMAVMLVVIVAVTMFVLRHHDQSPFNGNDRAAYDQKEIELAKIEAEIAFAYIGKYSRRTGEIIRKDIIQDRVMKPVGKSVVDPMYPFPRDE